MEKYKEKNNNELKNFYLFIIGQFVSQFGSKMTSYGFILWGFKESGSVLPLLYLLFVILYQKYF